MIPGLCRIWARRQSGDNMYWFSMPYAARGYRDCVSLVDHYQGEWGNHYQYRITADHDLCRPVG